jgi:hypothetical protein
VKQKKRKRSPNHYSHSGGHIIQGRRLIFGRGFLLARRISVVAEFVEVHANNMFAVFGCTTLLLFVLGSHRRDSFHPRCSRKKRTGESREKNAGASVPEQRSRQQRRPSVHAVKHHSTSRTNTDVSVRSAEKCRETPQYFAHGTNTDVSVRSAEKCTLSVERSKEAQLFVRVRA